MGTAQSAICEDSGAFGIFITLCVAPQDAVAVGRVLADLPRITRDVAEQCGESALRSAAAFGAEIWPHLFSLAPPQALQPFAPLQHGDRQAPATGGDVLLHLHSPRHDVNFVLARRILAPLRGLVRIVEEIHGFRYLGGRDLTGFVDGTENPTGEERAQVALLADGPHAGGSYVHVQRYVHDLPRWEEQSQTDQEQAIGRTKPDDLELPDGRKPPSAHIARVVIEEDGEELEILRHSLPYGTTSENGLYFIAYGSSPHPFRRMLERMIAPDPDGPADHLLDFTRAVTGAAFFAPSEQVLGLLRG